MSYDVFASPVAVSLDERTKVLGQRFSTVDQALAKARELRLAGYYVWRVTGPNGFEMTEQQINDRFGHP